MEQVLFRSENSLFRKSFTPVTKQYISYDEIEAAASKLAKVLILGFENSGAKEAVLLTFVRGGLNTSAAVIRYLPFKPTLIALGPSTPIIDPHCLLPGSSIFTVVVDDILDTGKTAQRLKGNNFWRGSLHLFLHNKPGTHRVYTPQVYAIGTKIPIPDEVWCVYPWESEDLVDQSL